MKRTLLIAAAFGTLLTLGAQAQLTLVGVSFDGRSNVNVGSGLLAATAVAGVIPQMNFNNITNAQYSPPDNSQGTGFTFNSPALLDSTGAATPITFSIMANDSWNSGSGTGTPNNTLLNGIIKAQNNNDLTDQQVVPLTINGLTPGAAYTIEVYTMENGAGGQYSITDGVSTFFQEAQDGPAYAGTFIQGTNTVSSPGPVANYVEFNGTVGAGGIVPITYTWISGSDGTGIAGFQVQQVIPEPTTAVLGGLGLLGLALRRRRA